jgi:integrase
VTAAPIPADAATAGWRWPIDPARYDCRPAVTSLERTAIRRLGTQLRRRHGYQRDAPQWQRIERLLRPLDDARAALSCVETRHNRLDSRDAVALVLLRCADTGRVFWDWSDENWTGLIGTSIAEFCRSAGAEWTRPGSRPYVVAYAYLLGGFTRFEQLGAFQRLCLAQKVFGPAAVQAAAQRVADILGGWGYHVSTGENRRAGVVLYQALLLNRSPSLEDLGADVFERLRQNSGMTAENITALHGLQRAVAALGLCDPPQQLVTSARQITGTSPAWADWIQRWYATSTLTPNVRRLVRGLIAKAGRWLATEHPEIIEPGQWTRQTCAAWVAAVDRMNVGDYVQSTPGRPERCGQPLSPRSKSSLLDGSRTFFRDCQEWEWIPRRFNPNHALATPTSIKALIGPDPRVIADDIWAKLLWAGLNIEPDDLPLTVNRPWYPIELIRAITLTWLFSGQRSDEIARLRVGCIRWQRDGTPVPGDSDDVLARDAVCLLDIPTHKTGTAFTKPVDPLLGKAIDVWQAIRPDQPTMRDPKTGEHVDFLFVFRARRVSNTYINATIIPALCAKAGVPTRDVRGNITSHRARSTIASQLYNAKEPMTLFELQEWLGHRTIQATQSYTKITPTRLAKAYRDAGYFARNIRTIEVLVDRDAVTSGAAASGKPWQYYDLGPGYCTYTFFEQCPHRMACPRCDFYAPKNSSKGQLLEAKDNLQRMLAEIPLTDDERAAVDDGQTALDHLLQRLIDVPTPAGATPRQIGIPPTATLLPIAAVKHGKQDST